jgi:hypothetical protein
LLMSVSGGLALRRPDRLLEFFRETIDVHAYIVAQALACEGRSRLAASPEQTRRSPIVPAEPLIP